MSVEKLPRGKSWAGLIGEPSDYRADNRKQSQPGDDIIAIWRNGQPVAAETPYQPIQCHSLTIRGEDFRLVGLYTAYAAACKHPLPSGRNLPPEISPMPATCLMLLVSRGPIYGVLWVPPECGRVTWRV